MESLRLFVSLPVPDWIRLALHEFTRALELKDVRWTPAEQIHLTLIFLGKVESTALPELQQNLQDAIHEASAFELQTSELGAFPSLRRPRVIWIGLAGDLKALLRLQQQVAAAISQWCETREAREFNPHLTIGRARERSKTKPLNPMPPPSAHWRATEVFLMRSQLSSHGATHYIMNKFPLQ